MPYSSNSELPESVRNSLPDAAQTVFRQVANTELDQGSSEESAMAQAWTAVKNGWEKKGDKWIKKMAETFEATSEVCKVDDSLGLVFGYAMVCKIDGEDHYDLQGHHIPEDTMLRVLAKFMEEGSVAKEMHSGAAIGKYVFAFPLTTEIAKSLDIEVKQTGAIVAMKPDSDSTLQKFRDGTFTGFSIGGIKPVFEDVDE